MMLKLGQRLELGFDGTAGAGGGGAPYVAKAVHLDGSTWLSTAALTGASDGASLSLSVWIRSVTSASPLFSFDTDNASSPQGQFQAFTPGIGALSLYVNDQNDHFTSDESLPLDGTWHHVLLSMDLTGAPGAPIGQCYIDDVAIGFYWHGTGEGTQVFSGVNLAIPGVPTIMVGDLADYWLDTSFVDFSIENNRRKFIDAGGKPASPAGFPTAFVLFSGDHASFSTNQGSGGAFTLTGALTDAGTSPSN